MGCAWSGKPYYGLRVVGKTVLLERIRFDAEDRGLTVVSRTRAQPQTGRLTIRGHGRHRAGGATVTRDGP